MSKHNDEWIGKTLGGRYQINELLGKGGMSAVYKAFDPNLKRVVAVKLIHSHLSQNPEFLGRFETEAAAVAKLRHPGIVQVYDFNHDEGVFYMVLEYIEGESLFDRLEALSEKGNRLDIKDAVQYAMQVSEAVDYAHQKNMIHRDIKPANVIITPQNQAVLMDFGIAKIIGEQAHTTAGNVIGTVKYMAPEQIMGQQPDNRVDIYATGVMLFEMLAGRAPFEADSAVTMMKMHLHEPVPDLQELGGNIPANICAITAKALEKDRDKRYRSAGEMANALKKTLIQYEHKEAELFRTVRLTQDELEEMTAATQQVAVTDLPQDESSIDPGKTRIIDEQEKDNLVAASQTSEIGASKDPNKTVAVQFEEAASGELQPSVGKSQDSSLGSGTQVVTGMAPATPDAQTKQPKRKLSPVVLAIGALAAVAVVLALLASVLGIFGGGSKTAAQATATQTVAVVAQASSTQAEPTVASPTEAPTEAPQITEAPVDTEVVEGAVNEDPNATQDPGGVENENPYATAETGSPAASQPGDIIFQLEFDDPADASLLNITGDDNAGDAFTADVVDGQLQMTVANAQAAVYAEYNLQLENPDVRVETLANKVAGPNSNEIGVICRSSEQGFYFLAYTSAGKWIIYRFQPGTSNNGWTTLATGTSNAIQMTNASNQVAGICAGNQLILEVNGTQIGAATDDVLTSGGFAGAAIWGEFPGLGVNLDYLYASVP